MSSKKWSKRLDWFLAFLLILGVATHALGTACNALVMAANHGLMPVVGDIGDAKHVTADEHTKLVFLADRFLVEHPLMDEKKLFRPVATVYKKVAKFLDLPEDGLHLASIGDLMRWGGAALFLFMIPPVLLRIPFRLARDGIRFEWKRRK
ncbi:MAG: hypothetical protein A2762_01340 [Candidatus Lloydbacteria bacterium RIFCSPHIGHO2_01_FULL_54_11]|nr:MAG: hypothetical protein A2762_01340 [Candidatus Lloydbacteria bacterium RIFCSPHIGHO2_01_FULL_54_11]OGZ13547.1 MAG: hypothetical protein A2948_05000 [Candidatus Lloydbacteria bacterium RIFCSPLOWO2_01_FULL_54_18]